jgi:hypothetical protein
MKYVRYLWVCFVALAVACSEDINLPESTSFIKLYGGNKPDYGVAVEQLNDGGYIYVGSSLSYPEGGTGKDICLVKTDPHGDRKWIKYYGGEGDDQAKSVKPTPDGGFLILGDWGETAAASGETDYYLIKTDAEGEIMWSKKYGLPARSEQAKSMNTTLDGGIIIAGNIIHDEEISEVYLIKTNAEGEIIWEIIFGLLSLPNEVGSSIIPLPDGSFVLCGTEKGRKLSNNEDTDVRIMKISSEGAILWSYSYGGPTSQTGVEIQAYPGGFICVGTIYTTGEHTDIFLLNIDYSGNMLWSKTLGGNHNETGISVSPAPDGGFTICGTTESYGEGGKDIYLLKVDKEGSELWSKTFGGSGNDEGSKIIQVKDGGFVIAGTIGFDETNTLMGLLKTDAQGELIR